MNKEPNEKNPFKSSYSEKFITPAQFIAEIMCTRIAKKDGKDLPQHFWFLPSWKRTFLMQLRFANGLLKIYNIRAILAALKKAKWIYSLGFKMKLDPLIQEEQIKLNNKPIETRKEIKETKEIVGNINRTPFNSNIGIAQKLKDL